ncbi:MAG TPA: lactonase family protein [Steroidobacteraceae bacterium]|nr:lactonase family protein [Steroidobacteraceae bacterium]
MKHALVTVTLAVLLTSFGTHTMARTSLLYIATQNPEKMGITVAEFDSATGRLSTPKMIMETRDPAHFTLSADGSRLYMCNTGTPGGVSAFAVQDKTTGALQLLNYKESRGRGPSYVSVDKTGHYVLDANYGGGFVEVHSLAADGSLDQQTAFVQHEGSSVHPQRQTRPYAHWIRTDPTNKFALVADLGTDKLVIYKFDEKTGRLTANDPAFTKVNGGSGPRHLAFHPNGKWLYAVQEISNEVIAFNWDSAKGTATQFQQVKTLPADYTEPNTAAEIAVRSDGKFVYVTNRGHDSIVLYSVDARTGELTLRQRVPSRGKVPRYFTFDPGERWLIVSNQESGNVTVFSIDAQSGELAPVGEPVAIPRPMAVAFLK